MKISICVPCHNRTYDLKKALPTWIDAANASPPVEIVVLDYNSPDDLQEYIKGMGNVLCPKYTGRNYYHMAHARNLSVLATTGEWFIQLHTDCIMRPDFIFTLRMMLKYPEYKWMTVKNNEGVMIMKKRDFIDTGGYDERFEFYSPEDKDLRDRLVRRGMDCWFTFSPWYVKAIYTPNEEKIKNYRLSLSKRDMAKMMSPIYHKNIENNVMVANAGIEWGKWIP